MAEKENMLGFGCMRLPLLDPKDSISFDYERMEALFDAFLERGFTYFDTAYTYHGYRGEEALRRTLVERHPRERFQLATKLPLRDFKDVADMEQIFEEQLQNCGVEFFDAYLLHNMVGNLYEKCRTYGAFDFLERKKQEGRIRAAGMSFHDTPELLEEILSAYGDKLDFVQLQVNYVDWEQPNVQSKRCLAVAEKFQKPVVVMEPCKGGTLVNLPEEALKVLKAYAPERSAASWALRFAAGQKGVVRVLTGMNQMEQLLDNADTFTGLQPLNPEELEVIGRVREIIEGERAVACTACGYCTHGCPMHIAIPAYFGLYNSILRTTGSFSSQQIYYNNLTLSHGKAGTCIGCGQCEKACPQHLPVIGHLKAVAEKFETGNFFPVRR